MSTGVVLVLLTGLLWSFIGVVLSYAARLKVWYPLLALFSSSIGVVVCLLFFSDTEAILNTKTTDFSKLAVVMISSGVIGGIANLSMQTAMSKGHHGITWSISQSALIGPFLFGVLFYGETAGGLRLGGLVCIVASLAAFGANRSASGQKTGDSTNTISTGFLWALLALVLFASQQILTVIPSKECWEDVGKLRTPLIFVGSIIMNSIMIITLRSPQKKWGLALLLGLAMSVITIISRVLLFRALDILATFDSSAIGYPIAVGTCIIGFSIYSMVILKETINHKTALGLLLGICGIICICFQQ